MPTSKSDKKILVIEGDFINSYMLKQFLEDDFKMSPLTSLIIKIFFVYTNINFKFTEIHDLNQCKI